MRHYVEANPLNLDYAVLGEPSNTENIVIGYKGLLHLQLCFETETGHSAVPWRYENAVEKGIEIWNLIKTEFAGSGEQSHFHSLTGCLTGITGGEASNVVPSECTLTLDVRIPPDLSSTQVLKDIRKIIGSYLNDNPKVSIDLEVTDHVEGCLMNSDSVPARSFSWAIRRVRGKNPTFLKKTGTSDMNLLVSKAKIPTIAYGPGDSKLDHTPEEEITFRDYLDSIEIIVEALERLILLHNKIV
jgi:LysW-gamma-L-lysine carboxypeptidase